MGSEVSLEYIIAIVFGIVTGIITIVLVYNLKVKSAFKEIEALREKAVNQEEDLNRKYEAKRKEAFLEAKEESYRIRADIEKENKLLKLTTDEGEHRLISIDDSTIRLIKNAYGQLFYTENNGMETYSSRNPEPKKTKINSVGRYVFRVPGQKKFSKSTHSFFISRMSRFKKWLNNPYLTYNALRDSGIVQSAIDKEKNGEITKEDYMDIYDRFNYRVGSNETYWYTIRSLVEQYREILQV